MSLRETRPFRRQLMLSVRDVFQCSGVGQLHKRLQIWELSRAQSEQRCSYLEPLRRSDCLGIVAPPQADLLHPPNAILSTNLESCRRQQKVLADVPEV